MDPVYSSVHSSLQLGELLDNVRHFHLSCECSNVLATKVFEAGLYQRVGKYMFFPSNWLTDWYVGLCDSGFSNHFPVLSSF